MSSTRLDKFAAAALTGLLARSDWDDADAAAREAYRLARAMMAERARQDELPDSETAMADPMNLPLAALKLNLRIEKKLATLGLETVRDLTLTTEKAVRSTGLKDESVDEIRQSLHRLGLHLGT